MIFYKNSTILALLLPLSMTAQKIEQPTFQIDSIELDSGAKKWSGNIGLGWDLNAISLINPRVSDGSDEINFGGLLNFAFGYQSKKLIWNNRGNLQLALSQNAIDDGWLKSADVLAWNTQIGILLKHEFYAAAMVDVQTQVLPTYDGKFLSTPDTSALLTGKFFTPANLKIAPGILWKPKRYFSVIFSTFSNKNIVITQPSLTFLTESLSETTVFGSQIGKKWTSEFGAELRADLNLKFADERLILNSVLDLYTNYLRNPQNVDVEWLTSLDMVFTSNFSLNMRSDWFYDHDVSTRIGGDMTKLKQGITIRNTFFLKYVKTF